MKYLLFLCSLFVFGCGYSSTPPYVPYTTQDILNQNNCQFGYFDIGEKGETGVIDSSYDLMPQEKGIQTSVRFKYSFGVPPEYVNVSILQDGKILYTTNPEEGVYEAWLDIEKKSPVMIQVFSYGWCRKPTIITDVQ